MYYIIYGKPGSGKTTIAKHLSEEFQLDTFCFGDFLRSRTDAFAREILTSQTPCDPKALAELVYAHLPKQAIIEGYPRNMAQYDAFFTGNSVKNHIYLDISDRVALQRLKLRNREDVQTSDQRLSSFYKHTMPLIEYLRTNKNLISIDASQEVPKCIANIVSECHK